MKSWAIIGRVMIADAADDPSERIGMQAKRLGQPTSGHPLLTAEADEEIPGELVGIIDGPGTATLAFRRRNH
jgi:hypothetical protein